jgi:hypothetical protein
VITSIIDTVLFIVILLLLSIFIVDGLSNGTGAEKIASERKFVFARFRITADKPFSPDQLNLRFRPDSRQTAVSPAAPVGQIKNLSGNFEFHRGHIKLNVGFLQSAEIIL